jgi:hypothetical protein
MIKREFSSGKRYFAAFVIGTAVFLLGFFLTSLVARIELRNVGLVQNQLSYGLFEQKLIHSFFEGDICGEDSFSDINKYRAIQGAAIGSLEKKFGKDNELVLERKKFYTLIQIAHFEFLMERKKSCNESTKILIFFYSNKPKDAKESADVGNLLDVVGNRGHKLQVYSFDYFLDSELIELLKKKYEIREYPIIFNPEGAKVISPTKIGEIESIIG